MKNFIRTLTGIAVTTVACNALFVSETYAAETTLRLSHIFRPDSAAGNAAQDFANEVAKKSNGRIEIKLYPSSQLGDWTETHSLMMQGAVDMGLQPLSTSFDKRLAIAWFPYIAPTYNDAEKAYSQGGFAYNIVDEIIKKQNLKLLGVYADGMGGAGFTKVVNNPEEPNAKHDIRIRVWPGGTTHQKLMKALGYQVAVVPWAELYTGMQTGVVDGQIGGSPELANSNFADITKTWLQYNDHLELAWFVMNNDRFSSLSKQDQAVLLSVAQDISKHRFSDVKLADAEQLKIMEEKGTNVVRFTPEQLNTLATFAREKVWPEISDELGDGVMAKLRKGVGISE